MPARRIKRSAILDWVALLRERNGDDDQLAMQLERWVDRNDRLTSGEIQLTLAIDKSP